MLDEKSWVNDEKKLNMRKEIIPIGAKIILVEKIVINDEMSKFFDNGLIIHAEGKVIENKPNENMLKFEWEEKHLNKLWYHNLFENNLSFVSKNGKSVNARNFANFIFDGVPQDLDYYIKKYGKVQSKIDLIDDESSINNEVPNNNTYTKDDFLLEVFIDSQEYEKLKDLIYDKQNLILQGAPGVGKTYMAKRLAYSLIGEVNNKYLLQLQFHQSYSYEDLIMGYRPFGNNFKLVKGPFYSFIKQAINDQNSDYFIIIDEINRGNISKIFGELLMLIEADKRGEANAIKLMYSNEDFYIPRNIYILGMMNTADRSLALIDYALRRRFVFYTMKPAFDNITFQEMLKGTKNINLMRLVEGIKELNKEIRSDDSLGQGFEIGHSYFTRNYEVNNSQVKNIIDFEIEPLLREYWYDDEHKIERHLRLLLGKMHE